MSKLVLENVQGEMKPIKRRFGNQYLVEYEDGHREYVPATEVTEKVDQFYQNKYSTKKKTTRRGKR